jgi:hypothetical protein
VHVDAKRNSRALSRPESPLGSKTVRSIHPPQRGLFEIKTRHASDQLENRNWKLQNSKRKTPPLQTPQGWATQRRLSELRRGHPPTS